AIMHYRVSRATSRKLQSGELFLLDSGGQYQDGTTDITRTVPIGTPTEEMRERFTLVLKGMIGISMLRFPPGTRGSEIDAVALRELQRLFHLARHVVPCRGLGIVGMICPLIVRVARSRAQGDQRNGKVCRGLDDHAKPAQAVVAHGPVGMGHVVGSRERCQGDTASLRCVRDGINGVFLHRSRHRR
ncbi:MAG: M24 family metallopeptidase, partial [Mesorhizobium sp.]